MDPNQILFVQVAGALGTILGAWLLIGKIIIPAAKRIGSWFNSWEQFMVDWSGTEARRGRDRIPGVMERLNDIDGELKNNGGSSVKDAVDRIEISVAEIHDKTDKMSQRLEEGDKKFSQIEKRLKNLEDKL